MAYVNYSVKDNRTKSGKTSWAKIILLVFVKSEKSFNIPQRQSNNYGKNIRQKCNIDECIKG